MLSYTIQLEQDTLRVDFGKTEDGKPIPANGNQIVLDALIQLEQMAANGILRGGNLLKIDGRLSVLVSYVIAHQVAHLYRTVAVADTRLGAYVVVISTTRDYPIGSCIAFDTGQRLSSLRQPLGKLHSLLLSQAIWLANIKCLFRGWRSLQSSVAKPPEFSFLLQPLEGELIAQINPRLEVDGDQIVRDAFTQLHTFADSGRLLGGTLLTINGRATVLSSFVLANHLAHRYGAIAVFDPKLSQFVVVISHGADYRVGDLLPAKLNPRPTVKVVLCGPANTGKTILRDGLKAAILRRPDAPNDFYVISGCPDGDGSWFSETAQRDPQLAYQLKQEYKAKFTAEFAQAKARDIRVIPNSLLLFDVGGKLPSLENQVIMSEATHAVILAKTPDEAMAWQTFCEQLTPPLPVVAIIYSDQEADFDQLDSEISPVLVGKVHRLVRGQDVSQRPVVQALAQSLIQLVLV